MKAVVILQTIYYYLRLVNLKFSIVGRFENFKKKLGNFSLNRKTSEKKEPRLLLSTNLL